MVKPRVNSFVVRKINYFRPYTFLKRSQSHVSTHDTYILNVHIYYVRRTVRSRVVTEKSLETVKYALKRSSPDIFGAIRKPPLNTGCCVYNIIIILLLLLPRGPGRKNLRTLRGVEEGWRKRNNPFKTHEIDWRAF